MVSAGHDIALRGPRFMGAPSRPVILQRTDRDFIAGLLDALSTEAGRQGLAPADDRVDGVLRLYQPVQRVFHLLLADAECVRLGRPRLDPKRIESAGFVVRRLGPDGPEGWMRSTGGSAGWVRLSGAQQTVEPDAARRAKARVPHPLLVPLGPAKNAGAAALSEQVTQLFVAPPAVCEAAGRTLLYGVIPTSSSERTAAPTTLTFEPAEEAALMPPHLKAHPGGARPAVPYPGERIGVAHASAGGKAMADWVTFLQTLQITFDAFDGASADHAAFRAELDGIGLTFADGIARQTSAWLHDAAQLLVLGEAPIERRTPTASGEAKASYVEMPVAWPVVSTAQAARLQSKAVRLIERRAAQILPERGRYDEPGVQYHVRAFVRERGEGDCPPKIHFGEPSEPFTIAAWYENGPTPPLQIQLPDLLPGKFKSLKPNVAFQVPGGLFDFLRSNSPKDLMKGEGRQGSGPGLGWICGFNIPIITLCAFIVLFIFLALLNIIFFWLPWVRICIPFPAKAPSPPAPGGAP